MKLKKIKIENSDHYSLCILTENEWIAFRAVLDSVDDDGSEERARLEKASDDLIVFLKDRDVLQPIFENLLARARQTGSTLTLSGEDVMPFRPLFYRDFMLSEKHVIQSTRGFARRLFPAAYPFIQTYEAIFRRPFPAFKPKQAWYENPTYYKGNVLSFVSDGEIISFPKYAEWKDYELELGIIISKDIFNATEQQGFEAIGAFCIFNDFSVRNVQYAEMKKTGMGPCKSKDFANSISNIVVTAEEILPILENLKARVIINDKLIAEGQLDDFYHSLGKMVAYASKGERVYAGEFMGCGTVPNCCGMENGVLLECGDVIRLEIDHIGSLTNPIGRMLI